MILTNSETTETSLKKHDADEKADTDNKEDKDK